MQYIKSIGISEFILPSFNHACFIWSQIVIIWIIFVVAHKDSQSSEAFLLVAKFLSDEKTGE